MNKISLSDEFLLSSKDFDFSHKDSRLADQKIALEVSLNLFSIQQGVSGVTTGDYEHLTQDEERAFLEQAISKSSYKYEHYISLVNARNFAFNGLFTDDLDNMHDQFGLVLMGQSTADLYSCIGTTPASEAILCAFVARLKVENTKTLISSDKLSELCICEQHCVGGYYKGLLLTELALLSKMTVQGVKNALSRPGAPKTMHEYRDFAPSHRSIPQLVSIDAKEAYQWLKSRRDFVDTYIEDNSESGGQGSTLLVPQARDKSVFDASCRMSKGYKVGKRGNEQYFEHFEDALSALRAMPKAYWRRPSPTSGVSGIVSAATWVNKTPSELGI